MLLRTLSPSLTVFPCYPLDFCSNLGHFSFEGSVLVLISVLLCRTHINLSAQMPLSISVEYPASAAAPSKPNRLFFCAFPILPLKFCIAPFWCPLLYCLPLSIAVTLSLCSHLWLSVFHLPARLAFSLPVSSCVLVFVLFLFLFMLGAWHSYIWARSVYGWASYMCLFSHISPHILLSMSFACSHSSLSLPLNISPLKESPFPVWPVYNPFCPMTFSCPLPSELSFLPLLPASTFSYAS